MKKRDPLEALHRAWLELDALELKKTAARTRAELELRRLSRNKHQEVALRAAYWDPRARTPVALLAELFRVAAKDVAARAGPLEVTTSCLLCRARVVRRVPNRAARAELEREKGVNPKWRICSSCRAFRALDLALLRKKPGEALTAAHRAAYAAYLTTPQWKERRAQALRRARHKCSMCSRKRGLETHHRTYERIGEELPEDLIVICRQCHGHHHGH